MPLEKNHKEYYELWKYQRYAMADFTPISGFLGGCLIGLAAILYLIWNHRICGISGIFQGLLPPNTSKVSENGWFILGLLTAGFILRLLFPVAFDYTIPQPLPVVLLGGFCVGFGSSLGNGCTSGHGVCGIGRLSTRSIVATALFFAAGVITASIIGWFL